MIQNLNRLSFAAYGRVTGERLNDHGFPIGGPWKAECKTITGKTDVLYRCEDAPVYMDYESGMAVLLVSRDGAAAQSFYLDKPVCIDAGVYYCVIPFDESCVVHLCLNQNACVSRVVGSGSRSLNILSANMAVRSIRTLFYQEKESGFFFKGESHRQYELTYMDKGSMHSIVGGQDYLLEAGEMMLYGPDQWHSQYAEGDAPVCFLTIAFDMDCDYADILLNHKWMVEASGAAMLNGILRESRQADILSGDFICCQLMRFLLGEIRRAYRGEQSAPLPRAHSANSENSIVDLALRHISENVYEKLSVASVARAVNVSPSYLSVLFDRHLNIKPSDYIRREKLEESKRQIRRGEWNFSQIADQLKFSSIGHFSNLFKKWYGVTPSEFSRSVASGEMLSGEFPQSGKEE